VQDLPHSFFSLPESLSYLFAINPIKSFLF